MSATDAEWRQGAREHSLGVVGFGLEVLSGFGGSVGGVGSLLLRLGRDVSSGLSRTTTPRCQLPVSRTKREQAS